MPFLPDVFMLGQFPLAMVAVTGLLGGVVAYWLAGRLARLEGSDPAPAQDVVLNLLLGGVLGAKLIYVLMDVPGYVANPQALLIFPYGRLGMLAGLLAGAALAGWGLWKQPSPLHTLDLVAAPLVLGAGLAAAGWHAPGSWAFAPLLLVAGAAALLTILRRGAPGERAAQAALFAATSLVLADLARPAVGATRLQLAAALLGTGAYLFWRWTAKKDSQAL